MHPLFAEFQANLFGRLKARALSSISGTLEEFPSQRETISHIMDEWRGNAEAGRVLFNLIYCTECNLINPPQTTSKKKVRQTLELLGRYKAIGKIFFEVESTSETDSIGFMMLGHDRPNGKPGYYVALFTENDYPKNGWISIVPGRAGEARIDVLGAGGWRCVDEKEASRIYEIGALIEAIWLRLTRPETRKVKLSDIKVSWGNITPEDAKYNELIGLLFDGQVKATSATTSIDKVIPFDLDFCLSLKGDYIDHFVPYVASESPLALVTYWNGDSFVSSDDYYTYAAYRRLGRDTVSMAILGDFPTEAAAIQKIGGAELLPPFVEIPFASGGEESQRIKKWRVDLKLAGRNYGSVPSELAATWLVFADMLGSKSTSERGLHDFIREHPIIISSYATRVESEVRLGGDYRIDLVLRSSGVCEEVTLVELEHHRHPIFTSQGRPHHKVTHATQQVRDWIQWLGENPTHPMATGLGGIKPKGIVVMGRSAAFSEKERRLLANLNESSTVKVLTYDEILDRFRDLILLRSDDVRI